MKKSFAPRNLIPVEQTWDLSPLIDSIETYNAGIAQIEKDALLFNQKYTGNIIDSSSVVQVLTDYEKLNEQFVPFGAYASLSLEVDQTNDDAQMRASKFGSIASKIGSQLSFVHSDLSALSTEILEEAATIAPQFENYLKQIIKKKAYQLHPEVEKTLAALSSSLDAPYELYNTTKLVDMKFDNFTANGESFPLNYSLFEGDWELESDVNIRRAAFEAFSKKLREYQHTTAKTYNTHVTTEKTLSDLRGYESVTDYLLFDQEVDRTLYNRQIDLITTELAPHMRRYAKLLQKVHGLEKMTFADLKIPLDPEFEPMITVEESKNYIENALQIMGDEYMEMVEKSYSERWIDFAQNEGKSTGAFCSSPYGFHPYILISWTSRMNEVFVLAHELGHAGHFVNAHKKQSLFNSRPSTYFIEAPSTMNEMLMANYLLKTAEDTRFKRWVTASIISRTYYHNFVTHLLEAAYQRKVYDKVDAGESVNANVLNRLKREVLEDFWGDAVEITEGAELTWMRQPHYYMGLYPYTYSAGLTISTQVSQRILNEGQPAVEDWLKVLQAGGTKTPVELAQMAGVDITTDEPLLNTIAYIGGLIDQLEVLTEELNATVIDK
ncbi:oligoendopeptidase F [Viridibacillus sp. FSL R5-0477]|uniref:Oligopeptidase F n=1 Tax=Viridibacillus arenosi FSL R5-213 TaxID=1227360 RepID=W4EM54_9BACL|nr:oligoendopeptidase F [Viridibacillus arenosi]ETT81092.1 oligoendopeptidase F-like protein [Viridibacillus arenosi FSL R5-213]OMC93201.1 oligoendopeptidase F [Viridibacillus arenosi]